MMADVHLFNVVPQLPTNLSVLHELAHNLYWSWTPELSQLFDRVHPELWQKTENNPVKLLALLPQERLDELSEDEGFLNHLEELAGDYRSYMQAATWYEGQRAEVEKTKKTETPAPPAEPPRVAYFAAEYGLARCLPIYSGGLGVLSGDHLKASSDLGLPLVGVGLLYRKGYFQQYVNADGWQQEKDSAVDPYNAPLTLERDPDGQPQRIQVELPGQPLHAQIWRAQVGRIRLFLLDTNIPENTPEHQDVGSYLYGGDREMRLKQELLLGIGGVRALEALSIHPTVFHMNEGHSAFLALERIRLAIERHGLDYPTAQALCAKGNVFTTHTPVPAAFDLFSRELMAQYLSQYVSALGVDFERFLSTGRGKRFDEAAPFNMAVFAARNSNFVNGVSRLHGEVSRKIFHSISPDVPVHEVPIESITNGVHARTWTSADMCQLYDRYLGTRWREEPTDGEVWERIAEIPDTELWRVKERLRARLVRYARRKFRAQLTARGAPSREVAVADEMLDPEILTIGFARRFATYKRATLILRDPERLKRLLCHPTKPVQLLFAGKAHPKDDAGKRLIQAIVHFAEDPAVRRRVVFLENYDITTARYMVGGVDIWLNNPRRPLEASGTSGMKVLFNGGLNFSVRDGWWDEAFGPDVGWAIGAGEDYDDPDYQDGVESEAIYHILEQEIVALFYDRDVNDLPREWLAQMKNSMAKLCPRFNNHRMVKEYHLKYYTQAQKDYAKMVSADFAEARAEARWMNRIYRHWSEVAVGNVQVLDAVVDRPVGSTLNVEAEIRLGALNPDEVRVEAYTGRVDDYQTIARGKPFGLKWTGAQNEAYHVFRGEIPCEQSGQHGFRIRVRPFRKGPRTLFAPVQWE
jgi:starch phosphorylase